MKMIVFNKFINNLATYPQPHVMLNCSCVAATNKHK
jgi:hypothetical protein